MNEQEIINNTKSLNELCETLNAIISELREEGELTIDQVVDVADLPIFGGDDPKKTSGVWSWDATRVMVADRSKGVIKERCACGEADFHCICEV